MNRVDRRELQILSILGICLAIIGLTIAYALISEKLSISGTAKMESASWDIHFEDLSASTVGNSTYTLPEFSNTILTNYTVSLTAPGDSVTFQFKVVNDGNLSARLSSVVKSIPNCNGTVESDEILVCENLVYRLMNEDGTDLEEGTILSPESSRIVKLTIEYPSSMTKLPKNFVEIHNLDVDLLFVQN